MSRAEVRAAAAHLVWQHHRSADRSHRFASARDHLVPCGRGAMEPQPIRALVCTAYAANDRGASDQLAGPHRAGRNATQFRPILQSPASECAKNKNHKLPFAQARASIHTHTHSPTRTCCSASVGTVCSCVCAQPTETGRSQRLYVCVCVCVRA